MSQDNGLICKDYPRLDSISSEDLTKLLPTLPDTPHMMVARFINGLRQFNGLIAGVGRMKWFRFAGFNLLGAALWVAWWGGVAYFVGRYLVSLFPSIKG